MEEDNFRCDDCEASVNTLYEGWFKAVPTTWVNQGTADDGLLIRKRLCRFCVEQNGRNVDDD